MFLDPQMIRQFALVTSMVFQFAIYVISGLLIGGWIDDQLGVEIFFRGVFTFLGFFAGMYRLVNFLRNEMKDNETESE